MYLLGFYILMVSMGFSTMLSIVGGIAYAFASYNLIIIEAGHVNKGLVMATMAPILAGIILVYRKKYLPGIFLTLFFTGINVMYNHQQITYYLLLMIGILALTYFIQAIQRKEVPGFLKSSIILIIVGAIAVLPSLGRLLTIMDYTKETMRGGPVLQNNPEGKKESSGLEVDYAFQWSYGKAETITLLIPNFFGASSGYDIGRDSRSYEALRSTGQAENFVRNAPTYWGPQPFTSGPVYAGAIVCFLFLLGLFIVKGPEKWWLLIVTLLSILLSWGKHFAVFNEFLFHYLPLYNKFRTPSMALTMAGVSMVMLAFLALKQLIEAPRDHSTSPTLRKNLILAAGLTGGVSLFFALTGGSWFSFTSPGDSRYPEWLVEALVADRKAMLTTDAWRSFLFIAFAFSLLYAWLKYRFRTPYLVLGLGLLILTDHWSVDKRFLNFDDFEPRKKAKAILPTEADQFILQDKDPNYRVMNLTTSTFNESATSYFHKSVGGYSPVKLRRYQDIIDFHFSGNINMNVLNMLNTRYVIVRSEQGPQVQRNPDALGNAWFVDSIRWVGSPDEEIVALNNIDPGRTAVIDEVWKDKITLEAVSPMPPDSARSIELISYEPGDLKYAVNNAQAQLAVFSEVYYKTWKAYIDGEEVPLVRVNYILRGVEVPAGAHEIVLECRDPLYNKASQVSLFGSILAGIVLAGLLGLMGYRTMRSETGEEH